MLTYVMVLTVLWLSDKQIKLSKILGTESLLSFMAYCNKFSIIFFSSPSALHPPPSRPPTSADPILDQIIWPQRSTHLLAEGTYSPQNTIEELLNLQLITRIG